MKITAEDLKSVRTWKMQVERETEAVQRLRAEIESVTARLLETGGCGAGAQKDKLASFVARLEVLEEKRSAAVLEYEGRVQAVESWIATLPKTQAQVISARYLEDFRGWPWLARKMNISIDGAFTARRRALKRLPCEIQP